MSKKLNDFSISNTVERKKYNDFYNDNLKDDFFDKFTCIFF